MQLLTLFETLSNNQLPNQTYQFFVHILGPEKKFINDSLKSNQQLVKRKIMQNLTIAIKFVNIINYYLWMFA